MQIYRLKKTNKPHGARIVEFSHCESRTENLRSSLIVFWSYLHQNFFFFPICSVSSPKVSYQRCYPRVVIYLAMIEYDNYTYGNYSGPAPENLTLLMTNCSLMGCARIRHPSSPALPPYSELPPYIRIAATTVCAVILTIGTAGNVLVTTVVWRTKELRNSTNLFLINLSVADLLVLLVCVPPVLVELHSMPEVWLLGEGMCEYMLLYLYSF